MSVFARTILFFSSYAPLLLLFSLLDAFGPGWPSLLCAGVAVVSTIGLAVMWFFLRRLPPDESVIDGAKSRDADVMNWVVTYVVPFAAAIDGGSPSSRWALLLFAVIVAALYVRSSVFYVHPLLLLAGFHVYEATREGIPVIVLTPQRNLRQRCTLRTVRISPNVYLEALV